MRQFLLASMLLGMTFIMPNAGGWTTITPGGAGTGIHQYQVLPGPGQVAPNGARNAPTYQQMNPQYYPTTPSAPTYGGYGDEDDDE